MTKALGVRSDGPVSLRDVRRNRAEFAAVKDRLAPVDPVLLAELAANKAALAALREQIAVNTAERRLILAGIEQDRLARRAARAGTALERGRARDRKGHAQYRARQKVRAAEAKDYLVSPRRLTPQEFNAANASWKARAIAADCAPRSAL